ncbi:MAG TPA: potassium channel family protein [Gemmataceae bacterium]|nr:potassium channel family protein [Gemmataceae bacterium]
MAGPFDPERAEGGDAMAGGEPREPRGGGWRQVYRERRFGTLLVILVVLTAGPPVLLGFGLSEGWFERLLSLLMLAAILSLCFERRQRLFALAVGIPSMLFSLGGHALPGEVSLQVLFVGQLCEVLFLFGAAGLVVRSLFTARTLTFDSIFGAVCGYLCLGLGWAVLYSLLESFQPGSFAISRSLVTGGEASRPLPHVLTYYSFVTLTTVGFGDISPVSPAARTLSWVEAVTGQFYLAVIVAALVSLLVAKGQRDDVRR